MKVQIAVRNVQSEVEIDVDLTLEDLKKAFTDAVGYISTSTGETRRVGFGFTS